MATYVSPFTDFGFKKFFGEEANKDLLIDFLNELLGEKAGHITDLVFLKTEQLDDSPLKRKAVFDIYCTNQDGERFIVEMQKSKQICFRDRALYYATFPIRDQVEKGRFDYHFKKIFVICILDFELDHTLPDPTQYRHDVKLIEEKSCCVFHETLNFVYLEMPKFTKSMAELESRFDKWLYLIKHIHSLEQLPDIFRDKKFIKFAQKASLTALPEPERDAYYRSLKDYMDERGKIDYALITGREEGREEGLKTGREEKAILIAKKMLSQDFTIAQISALTGLEEAQVRTLQQNNQ